MAEILTLFGLCWLFVGTVIGLMLAKKRESHLQDIETLSTYEEFLEHYRSDWEYRWNKTCHAHSTLFSIICMVVGLSLNSFGILSPDITLIIVILLIGSVVLWTVSSFRSIKITMAIADLTFMAGVLVSAYALFDHILK